LIWHPARRCYGTNSGRWFGQRRKIQPVRS